MWTVRSFCKCDRRDSKQFRIIHDRTKDWPVQCVWHRIRWPKNTSQYFRLVHDRTKKRPSNKSLSNFVDQKQSEFNRFDKEMRIQTKWACWTSESFKIDHKSDPSNRFWNRFLRAKRVVRMLQSSKIDLNIYPPNSSYIKFRCPKNKQPVTHL